MQSCFELNDDLLSLVKPMLLKALKKVGETKNRNLFAFNPEDSEKWENKLKLFHRSKVLYLVCFFCRDGLIT
ncbi:MAG: hypothetical protein JWP69_1606 [Flaviaesturariibacter sp.]|nr:hypothetical protein [Flaviaesturariibacter sp.]